jgi:hypothetical protein
MPTGLENLDLRVYLDYPQERLNRKGPFVFATDGTQVDAGTKNNCIIDPVTLSVFGTPLPMTNDWKSGTGASDPSSHYYRFQKSDFTFTSTGGATDWKVNNYYANGDCYIFSGSGITARQQAAIQLTSGVERNEPLFISYGKLQKKNTDTAPILKLYWRSDSNVFLDTQLHFNSDGSCTVYRGYDVLSGQILVSTSSTALVGNNTRFSSELSIGQEICDSYGRLLGFISLITDDENAILTANSLFTYQGIFTNKITATKVQNYSRTESNYSQGRPISTIANPNDQFNDVYIIPIRGKELLVLTSYGLNFSHSFSDMNNPNPPINSNYYWQNYNPLLPSLSKISGIPIILPKGDFSYVIPDGIMGVQVAKLYFRSNWSIESQSINFSDAPPKYPSLLTGSIIGGQGSTAVTGTSTLFTSQLTAGDRISVSESNNQHYIVGFVDTINSDTSLYLVDPSEYAFANNYYKDRSITGNISFGIGSTVITGSGTAFTSELNKNDLLYDNNNNLIGQINTINSNTLLYLDSASSIAGTNQTPIYPNVNIYSNVFTNIQNELFGQIIPISADDITLNYNIITSTGSTNNVFNNVNKNFKIKINQKNNTSIGSTSSTDFGYALYSADFLYSLLNESLPNNTVDITSAIESLSLSRDENGQLSLSLDARHKMLVDLGIVKPNIISNRSIKVNLEPRQKQLSGTITLDGSSIITGVGTSFLTDFSVGDSIYKTNGTLIGIATTITNDVNLSVLVNNVPGIEYNIDYSNEPIYEPITIFDGYLDSPDITYIQGQNYENYSLLSFNAIDKKDHLNLNYFNVAPNFDNTNINETINNVLYMSGQNSNEINTSNTNTSPSLATYLVPINRNNSQGQYNFVINLGDSSGGFIEKLRSDFAQNYTFYFKNDWNEKNRTQNGFLNTSTFEMKDLGYVSSDAPPVILYLNETVADTYGGIPVWESQKRTIRNLQRTYETPEANRILITGLDKTDGSRIEFRKDDTISQNPLLAPSLRPDNWLGDVYPFVMINDKLNTFSDVRQAGNQFYDKLTLGREIISFECDLLTYFDSTTKFTSNISGSKTGTLSLNATSAVVGSGTSFTSQLSIGDTLYTNEGNVIGVVKTITDNDDLFLVDDTSISGTGIGFNTGTYFLNQYKYLDIGDTFYLADLNNNLEAYMIIDFSVDFDREYLNPTYDEIIPRSAKYRAKKVTIPANNPPVFANSFFTNLFGFNFSLVENWIVTADYELSFTLFALSPDPYATISFSLNNEPVGMTVSSSGSNSALIEWSPTSTNDNEVYENIQVIANDGTSTASYIFNVRVYPTL